MYSGQLASLMQYAVRQAICAAMTDQPTLALGCFAMPFAIERPRDVFVATHSLGSMILFEALGEDESEPFHSTARQFAERLQTVGMLANQLPLITLARRSRPPAILDFKPEAPKFLSLFEHLDHKVNVVAFTDMNDLLSYPIPEDWADMLFPTADREFTFVNYPVTNARIAWLWALADPARAHTGYWKNDMVISAMTHGINCR